MTDRVVAFDINAARVAAAAPIAARPAPAQRPNRPRHTNRALSRAQLSSVYAGLLGADISVADVLEHLQLAAGSGKLGMDEVAIALRGVGLTAAVESVQKPAAKHWPALAEMTSGQIVLVLSQGADGLHIYDTTCPDMRAEVSLEDFAQVYAGRILRAKTTMADLEARHTPDTKGAHWFWGEFGKYRRQLIEVAAGSLVANLLAVSVSLFSMQVYDRVIPYQSEPTLWVLAGGAMLGALGLIAALWAEKFDQISAFQNFIIMPMTFLSGVFYSVGSLPPFWQKVTLFNPVVYLVSGFRWSFYGTSDVGIGVSVTITSLFMLLCSLVIWWIFRTGYRLRA